MTDWTVGADRDLPIARDETWEGDAAKASIFNWAEDADGNIDSVKAKRGFLIYDADAGELRGSYKLPFALYSGGLKASPAGIRAAASRLPQTDAPAEVLSRARAVVEHYEERMGIAQSLPPTRSGDAIRAGRRPMVEKTAEITLDDGRFARFVASSNAVDRFGDVVEQQWDLRYFFQNPVFLWSHRSDEPPIGWVRSFDTNAEQTQTVARVEFLPEDVNPWADQLAKMVRLGALRAVSVGFIPLEREERFNENGRFDGHRYLRSELMELSLCSVPANPNAVALARSLDSDPRFLRRIFPDDPRPETLAAAAPKLVGELFPRRSAALVEFERLKRRA